ncbi:fluoride efflux transporter CrcB [Methylobacterium haplocladii]|uniref:Fluoride-specific ion channel FluC n=1 Tax=Methylobacterium haplocladii TaxID=1176176 RepID=A0A512IV95_9HYPH|nr:fluoride efflux transporter CrcB [Methylobacterium haplocladii]GEP01642.1 putative fluoride ion transporter CrcB [Methylobacterium haplocladii]GJD85922.1 Putative fluoride ion transporter CrcB [Methylobacterium haplocladii]GLS59933.1 putative fluoride ion transporter CrcB [Methylobacterium haplocladii]
MNPLLVFVGAGIGGVLRHGVNVAALRVGSSFPWGTLAINVVGSVLMGIFTGWFALRGGSMQARLFIATGILGGFTTFSTFSLEAMTLFERGETSAALAYVVTSVIVGIGGLALGLLVMRQIL